MKKRGVKVKRIGAFLLALIMLPLISACDLGEPASAALVINEVVTSNGESLLDPDYGSPDWIELYNNSDRDIDLESLILTDNAQNPDKTCLLPKVTIAARGYLIIYAGQNLNADDQNQPCVDFGLSKLGDTLILADTSEQIIQELAIPALDRDISYARNSDGTYGYCSTPTPGAANTTEIYSTLESAVNAGADIIASPVSTGIYITEVVSKNIASLPHTGCADCDWIELYNGTENDILLTGFLISDKEFEQGKSNLSGYTIPAYGYLLVCCCEDTCVNDDGHCCVKMGISRYGETVYLYDEYGRVVTYLEVPLLEADISYARRSDGSYGLCRTPTPAADNIYEILDSLAPTQMDSSDAVRINEVLPRNKYSLIDYEGDRSDWVELYNRSDQDVSLNSYYLSDDYEDLEKWAFGEVVIPAHSYLIVFLSGKEGTSGELHASFALGDGDEVFLLYDSQNNRVDVIELVGTEDNISIGRASDGSQEYYRQPTPNAPNAYAYPQADAVGFFQTDGLFINEVSANHEKGTGENDWIELYNGYGSDLNLEGYYLSDDPDNLKLFQIGSVTIRSGGYAVIEATSHATRQTAGVAPFGISASGETLFLSDPSGALIDVFETGALSVGLSSGRMTFDSSVKRVFFDNPTKGAANGSVVYLGYTAQPVFSETGLYQSASFTLSLSCTTEGAVICYTTDGSEPTANSSVYTGPVSISSSCVVRARAYCSGLISSPIVTFHYLFEEEHTVPVMCIAMDPDDFTDVYRVTEPSDIIERGAYFSYYEADGNLGVVFPGGIKLKGRGTLILPQKSFTIRLRGSYGQNSINYPFFDEIEQTEFASLALRNSGQDYDSARIRDSYMSRAVQGLNLETAATRPVVVYVNGEYYGLYDLNEELNADYLTTHYGTDRDAVDVIMRNTTVKQGSNTDFLRVRRYARETDLSNEANYQEFLQWVDADYFMDYIIAQSYAANSDMFNQKYWRAQDYSIKWRPIFYDLDFCFRSATRTGVLSAYFTEEGVPSANGSLSNMDIYCALLQNDGWRAKFIERYVEIVVTYFNAERMTALLDEMAAVMEPEMQRHIARWGRPKSFSYWQEEIAELRSIVERRPEYALNALKNYFGVSDELISSYIAKYSS
ncbi:MAG: lamin tail domain-containing protein [Clostridia bacterium]|nr:lamin tail domain-containing protein [Clostridia bacterium]